MENLGRLIQFERINGIFYRECGSVSVGLSQHNLVLSTELIT